MRGTKRRIIVELRRHSHHQGVPLKLVRHTENENITIDKKKMEFYQSVHIKKKIRPTVATAHSHVNGTVVTCFANFSQRSLDVFVWNLNDNNENKSKNVNNKTYRWWKNKKKTCTLPRTEAFTASRSDVDCDISRVKESRFSTELLSKDLVLTTRPLLPKIANNLQIDLQNKTKINLS